MTEANKAPATMITPGMVLGHTYVIESLLGRGGLGEVYRARHVEMGTEHAIKLIKPELVDNPTIMDLFRREASFLRQIRHDAVVSYDGAFRDETGRMYLVMEFIDGVPLSDLLEERPLGRSEWYTLHDRLAEGLAAAHDKGIVHRDLSPDNVIFPQGQIGKAKLIDFGIAKAEDPAVVTIIGDRFAGKYDFAAPEQLGLYGGQVDARADIYSLGLVLAAAAVGRPLDMGDTMASVTAARQQVPDLSEVPAEFRERLAAMLQPDPAERPGSASELLGAPPGLDDKTEIQRNVLPEPTPEPNNRRRLVAAAAVALVAAAGVTVYAVYPPAETPDSVVPDPGPPDSEPPAQKTLEQLAKGEPVEIYQAASQLAAGGEVDRALVLYETAAAKGHGPSALAVGKMYDPVLWGTTPSPFSKPNRRKAAQWYAKALELGEESARQRMEGLENQKQDP